MPSKVLNHSARPSLVYDSKMFVKVLSVVAVVRLDAQCKIF